MVKTTFGHRMAALLPLSMILILAACSNGAAADAEPRALDTGVTRPRRFRISSGIFFPKPF